MANRDRLERLACDGDLDAAAELVDHLLRADDRAALADLLDHLDRPWPLVARLGRPLTDWFDAPQPPATVLALTHVLLDAAASLHRAGRAQAHWRPGDIRVRELADDRGFVVVDLGWRDPDAIDAELRPWIDTLSPEQAASPGRATPADDVFAVTVLAWMLYTGGEVPWPGESEFERLVARREHPPWPPGAARRGHGIHLELERTLTHALTADSGERPATVDALRAQLDALASRDAEGLVTLALPPVSVSGYGAPPSSLLETMLVETVTAPEPTPRGGLLTRLGRWLRRGSGD